MAMQPDLPLEGIYGETILKHHREPRHREPIPDADLQAEGFNPFCGDGLKLRLKLDSGGRVSRVSCPSEGCSIVQASTSLMGDALLGKTLPELLELAAAFRRLMQQGQLSDEAADSLGELAALQAVRRYPVRVKCALLPWTTLEEGVAAYGKRGSP